MAVVGAILVYFLGRLLFKGSTGFFTYLATLLAARRMFISADWKSLRTSEVPRTREQALEYMRQSEPETVVRFYRKMFVYRFILTAGLTDGILAFVTILMQPLDRMLWYVVCVLMIFFTVLEIGICRDGWKRAEAPTDPSQYAGENDDALIGHAQIVHSDCWDTFDRIERLSGRPWKIFCTVCIAAAVLLTAAQMNYKFRVKDLGSGVQEMGGWQFRVLDDGTTEVVRYTGIWRNITVPSSFHGVPVSSLGAEAFQRNPGDEHMFSRKDLTSVRLPEGLIRIGDGTFRNCVELTELRIPDSVTWIGDEAFEDCRKLKEIVLPDGLIHIGDLAFERCLEITGIRIPDSVTEIGSNPFVDCTNLLKIEITENQPLLRICGEGLYCGEDMELVWYPKCEEIREVTVPPGVRRIGDCAFRHNYKLEKVILPEGLEEIGNEAFIGCKNLREITFPDSVQTIGNSAFCYCNNLTPIRLPDRLTQIGESAFVYCESFEEITIPAGVTEIRDSTFSFCKSLTGVVLPEGLTAIGNSAFRYCENLTRIVLPDGLTTIGNAAFGQCGQLASVVMPASVQDFGRKNPFVSSTVWIVTPGSRAEEFCRTNRIEFRYSGDEEPRPT